MRPLAIASWALLAIAVGSAWPAGAGSEVIAIPGTKVSIEPPPGFVLASQFPGVQNAELASSIMINELPFPWRGVTAGFTAEGLISRIVRKICGRAAARAACQVHDTARVLCP